MEEAGKRSLYTTYYPIFLSLRGRVCLVVGGGSVSERKVKSLLRAGACVRIVAPELSEWLREKSQNGQIDYAGRYYDAKHLDGVELVFAATSDTTLNRSIAAEAHRLRLWCNMATDPEEGSFILPAVFHRGPLTVAVGTSGASPAMARRIREKLEKDFDDAWVILLEMMAIIRSVIQSRGLDTAKNQELFRGLAELPLIEWVERREKDAAVQAICEVCSPVLGPDEMSRIWDELWTAYSL